MRIATISLVFLFVFAPPAFFPFPCGLTPVFARNSISLLEPIDGSKHVPVDAHLIFEVPREILTTATQGRLPSGSETSGSEISEESARLGFVLTIRTKNSDRYATNLLSLQNPHPQTSSGKTKPSDGKQEQILQLLPGDFTLDVARGQLRFAPRKLWERHCTYTLHLFALVVGERLGPGIVLAAGGPYTFRTQGGKGDHGNRPCLDPEPGSSSPSEPDLQPDPAPDPEPVSPPESGGEPDPESEPINPEPEPDPEPNPSPEPAEPEPNPSPGPGESALEPQPDSPSFGLWSLLQPKTPPPPREGSAGAFDPVGKKIYRFLGIGTESDDLEARVWEYCLSSNTWTAPTTAPAGVPTGSTAYHTATFDTQLGRTYIWGGLRGETGLATAATYSYDPATHLVQQKAAAPPGHQRFRHSAVLVPETRQWVVFGGRGDQVWQYFNNVFAYTLPNTPYGTGQWQDIPVQGASPAPRAGHDAVYDPVTKRMYVFGGIRRLDSGAYPVFGDMWALEFSGESGATWHALSPEGETPSPRHGHRMILLEESRCILLFGGQNGVPGTHASEEAGMAGDYLDDMWIYNIDRNTWTRANLPGQRPSPRSYFSLLRDPESGDIYLMGGNSDDGVQCDLWLLPVS